MKSYQIGEFKANLSQIIEEVQNGETIELVKGKKKVPIAHISAPTGKKPKKKRKLGAWEGKVKYVFADDFKMTEEEFVNLGQK